MKQIKLRCKLKEPFPFHIHDEEFVCPGAVDHPPTGFLLCCMRAGDIILDGSWTPRLAISLPLADDTCLPETRAPRKY